MVHWVRKQRFYFENHSIYCGMSENLYSTPKRCNLTDVCRVQCLKILAWAHLSSCLYSVSYFITSTSISTSVEWQEAQGNVYMERNKSQCFKIISQERVKGIYCLQMAELLQCTAISFLLDMMNNWFYIIEKRVKSSGGESPLVYCYIEYVIKLSQIDSLKQSIFARNSSNRNKMIFCRTDWAQMEKMMKRKSKNLVIRRPQSNSMLVTKGS